MDEQQRDSTVHLVPYTFLTTGGGLHILTAVSLRERHARSVICLVPLSTQDERPAKSVLFPTRYHRALTRPARLLPDRPTTFAAQFCPNKTGSYGSCYASPGYQNAFHICRQKYRRLLQ